MLKLFLELCQSCPKLSSLQCPRQSFKTNHKPQSTPKRLANPIHLEFLHIRDQAADTMTTDAH